MAQIGSQELIFAKGSMDPMAETLKDITRDNVDGIGYRKKGLRSTQQEIFTLANFESAALAKAELELYKAYQATLVTVIDDTGQTWTNVAVILVICEPIKKVSTSAGGLGAGKDWILRAHWILQHTETS